MEIETIEQIVEKFDIEHNPRFKGIMINNCAYASSLSGKQVIKIINVKELTSQANKVSALTQS